LISHPAGSCLWRYFTPDGEWLDRAGHTAVEARSLVRPVLGDDLVAPPLVVSGPVRQGPAPSLPEQPRRRQARRKLGRLVGAERGSVRP
jgi:hypothetical protein